MLQCFELMQKGFCYGYELFVWKDTSSVKGTWQIQMIKCNSKSEYTYFTDEMDQILTIDPLT